MRGAAAVLVGLALCGSAVPQEAGQQEEGQQEAGRQEGGRDPHARVRGMTVSCQTWGWEWGSDAMLETLDELDALGVNWVAIHPYARIRGDGTVSWRPLSPDEVWLRRPIAEAQARGQKILIKPHLAYWGSPFSWRGEIEFDDPAAWDRFFRSYGAWIRELTEVCHDADAFAVGTELDRTVGYEDVWRGLIEDVRERTDGVLTYAANWTDYQAVPFWDAVDVIGIQAYFPLVEEAGVPSEAALRRGWERILGEITEYAAARDRGVVFTELGYNRSSDAARRPWEYRTGGPNAETIQRRCMEVALEVLADDAVVAGVFLWKWFPGGSRGSNFLMSEPHVRAVIRAAWSER